MLKISIYWIYVQFLVTENLCNFRKSQNKINLRTIIYKRVSEMVVNATTSFIWYQHILYKTYFRIRSLSTGQNPDKISSLIFFRVISMNIFQIDNLMFQLSEKVGFAMGRLIYNILFWLRIPISKGKKGHFSGWTKGLHFALTSYYSIIC